MRCFSSAEQVDDDDDFGKGNCDPISCLSSSIACVCPFTFCKTNFATVRTNCEEVSTNQTIPSMNVEDSAQRSILRLNILFNPPVAAISVRMCITKRYDEILNPNFAASLSAKNASDSAFSAASDRNGLI